MSTSNELDCVDPAPATITAAGFDYTAIDPAAAAVARNGAAQIKQHYQAGVQLMFEIGETLIAVKQAVGHGHFSAWLTAEFAWTERTARNYMLVAGRPELVRLKSEMISDLPVTTIYQLARAPDEVLVPIAADLAAGAISPSEIVSRLDEARAVNKAAAYKEKMARRRARLRLSPEELKRAEARDKREQDKNDARIKEIERQRQAALSELAQILRAHLDDDQILRVAELIEVAPYAVARHLRGAE